MLKILKNKKITMGDLAGLASIIPVIRYGTIIAATPFIGGPLVGAAVAICAVKVYRDVSKTVDTTSEDFGVNPDIINWRK